MYIHSTKRRMRYDPEKIVTVNYMWKPDHLWNVI